MRSEGWKGQETYDVSRGAWEADQQKFQRHQMLHQKVILLLIQLLHAFSEH